MHPTDSTADLVRRVRAGDDSAAEDVFTRYARRLVAAADQWLADRLRGPTSGEDVVQSVFRTFFRRAERGEFRIDTSVELWALLIRITRNKARSAARRAAAAKRDAGREARPTADGDLLTEVGDEEPGPVEVAAFNDLLARLTATLSPLDARILELRLAGHTPTEVADLLGVTRMTVYRHLETMGARLTAVAGGEDEP